MIDPEDSPRYFTRSTRLACVRPNDAVGTPGILPAPDAIVPIGIAYGAGRVGGFVEVFDGPTGDWRIDSTEDGPPEVAWRLVIDDRCDLPPGPYPGIVKGEVEGRFVLRGGEFVELAEDTPWR